MDYLKKYCNVRIPDIMNELIKDVDNKKISRNDLLAIYDFHLKSNPYPTSNWNSCRIRVLSKISVELRDDVLLWYCHYEILNYMIKLSHKNFINNDFIHRDSIEYVVYGYLQAVRACDYLRYITKYNYIKLFDYVLNFLNPYINKEKRHLEFINSKISSDIKKPSYGKEFILHNPKLLGVFMKELSNLV